MSYSKRNKILFFVVVLNLVLILFTFKNFPQTFYQQDEWMGLGRVKGYGLRFLVTDYSFWEIISTKGRVLARPINYLFYRFFPLQITPFIVFSLSMHLLNSLLVFILAQKLSKKVFISATASVFFAIATIARQAVTWAGASTTTLPAATLIFLSLIFYLHFLEVEKKKFLYLALFSAITSLFFKEAGLFLYLLLPVLYFVYKKKPSAKGFLKTHLPFFVYGLLTVSFRFLDLLITTKKTESLFITGGSNMVGKLILHTFLYPLTSLSQIFFPQELIFSFARYIKQIQYPFINESPVSQVAHESVVSDMVSLFFSLWILFFFISITAKKEKRIAFFALSLTFASVLPYITLYRGNSYLDSRYFYIGTAGGAILLGLFCRYIKNFLARKLPSRKGIGFLLFLLLAFYFFWQIALTRTDIDRQVIIAQERKKLISALKEYSSVIPQKPIFFVTSNDDYIIKDNKLPLQQGIGYTLMVLYDDTGVIPKKLLQQNYLWNMLDQGYREIDGQGFGYFWDKEKLQEEFAKNEKLIPEQVIGFYYFGGDKQKLVDITDEVREFLRQKK